MTDDRLAVAELLAKAGDQDFLRTVAESVLPLIMEADVEGLICAGRLERSAERDLAQRAPRAQPRDPPRHAQPQDPAGLVRAAALPIAAK